MRGNREEAVRGEAVTEKIERRETELTFFEVETEASLAEDLEDLTEMGQVVRQS